MTKPTVLMTGENPDADMTALEADCHLVKLWEAPAPDSETPPLENLVRAVATRGDVGASKVLIDSLPHLEIIGCFGGGTNGIDRNATRSRGNGERLGIIGFGRIGKVIVRLADAFNMPVSYFGLHEQNDVPFRYVNSLIGLAGDSDFLVAIVPGGTDTTGLVTADVFKALGPDRYFINVARGSVVDQSAMLNALDQNNIKGACLDVYLNEPMIDPRFAKLDNVVLHSHHGSGTVETRRAMGKMVSDNLAAHFDGRPRLTGVM